MGVLSALEPKKVFDFFEEITKIPHGSGNVEQISDYLVAFAKKRNLKYIQDDLKNVIIFQDATPGYEAEPVMILQGHMDMVAVKKPELSMDMKTEGLQVAIDGDNVYAKGTSLGGDDGIAVAYALAILDSDSIKHPALEVVITVDEEVGMDGARGIDLSMLKGNRLLNLDSEEEGIFLTSCAGGARVACELAVKREKASGAMLKLNIGGLLGGHSGEEIDKERGNSNMIFGRVLWNLCRNYDVKLVSAQGGLADNAIPRETEAAILLPADGEQQADVQTALKKYEQEIQAELGVKDPGFKMNFSIEAAEDVQTVTAADTKRIAGMLVAFPNGVQSMSADMPGLVETSLNLGILTLTEEKIVAEFSVRSSIESAKDALIEKLFAITALAGGINEVTGSYPGWKYRADSPLREKMIAVYEKMYGKKPEVEAIHAGLECGLLGSKIEDLDCVSIGPNMKNIHTTEETLSISSTKRVWEYVVTLLETKEGE